MLGAMVAKAKRAFGSLTSRSLHGIGYSWHTQLLSGYANDGERLSLFTRQFACCNVVLQAGESSSLAEQRLEGPYLLPAPRAGLKRASSILASPTES